MPVLKDCGSFDWTFSNGTLTSGLETKDLKGSTTLSPVFLFVLIACCPRSSWNAVHMKGSTVRHTYPVHTEEDSNVWDKR